MEKHRPVIPKVIQERNDLLVDNAILTKQVETLTEDLDEAEAAVNALMDSDAAFVVKVDTLRGALEDLAADAQDLCDHEVDGGAPENRWDDLRSALIRTSKLVEISR